MIKTLLGIPPASCCYWRPTFRNTVSVPSSTGDEVWMRTGGKWPVFIRKENEWWGDLDQSEERAWWGQWEEDVGGYKSFTCRWRHSVAAFLLWGGVSEASTIYSTLGHPLCSCSVDANPVQCPSWWGGPYSSTWQTEALYLEIWFCGPNWCYVQPLLIYWVGPVLYASCVP